MASREEFQNPPIWGIRSPNTGLGLTRARGPKPAPVQEANPSALRLPAGKGPTREPSATWSHQVSVKGGAALRLAAAGLDRRLAVSGSGSSGHVVATNINIRFLRALELPNLEVLGQNIVDDTLEQGAFDLVHMHAVLVHLGERSKALDRMVATLKPGGWLLAEEKQLRLVCRDPPVREIARERLIELIKAHQAAGGGVDVFYGRRLYADLCTRGLVDVGAEGRSWMGRAASPSAQGLRMSYTQMCEVLLGSGELDAEDLDACLALFDDPISSSCCRRSWLPGAAGRADERVSDFLQDVGAYSSAPIPPTSRSLVSDLWAHAPTRLLATTVCERSLAATIVSHSMVATSLSVNTWMRV